MIKLLELLFGLIIVFGPILLLAWGIVAGLNGKYKDDSVNIEDEFTNFEKFKDKVKEITEKDEETKNYLLSRKNRNADSNTYIRDSSRSRESNGEDIPSNIQ